MQKKVAHDFRYDLRIKKFAHKLCLFNMTHISALKEYLKLRS
jgi:hypothetical protein